MRIGSLFSGLGALELGLERAGVGSTVWQVEADLFCREVLAKHWPEVERFDDVRGLTPPPADLICGGFPCQGFSINGRRAGLADERSGLWSDFARIIGELRPRIVLLENTPNILAIGWGQVLGDLAALGYDCEWDCVPASAVGAAHQRDRLFAVAYPAGERRETDSRIFDRHPEAQNAFASQNVESARMGSGRMRRVPDRELLRVANGTPDRLDRYRALGNAVVPQVAEFIGRRIMEAV